MQRLEALTNPTPATTEPTYTAFLEEEVLTPREPTQQAKCQESVRLNRPVVVADLPQVGEHIYVRFRRQKPPVFDGSPDPIEAEDWLKKI